ncbi:MAG TPA: hypothetical protein VJZ71_10220 [Phycisphaerae bacterium]|nr:hypothetical protein [Phycisphaerae bacterium]
MNTHKNNNNGLRAWSALCLVALGLTAGTGCDYLGTDSQTTMEAAANPSATMARLFNPVIESRVEEAESAHLLIGSRLEKAETWRRRLEAAEHSTGNTPLMIDQ